MYNFLVRRGTTIAFVIGFIISAIIFILNINGADGIASDDFPALYAVDQFTSTVGIGTFLVILAVIVILLGGIYGLIVNPKGALKFVIGAAVLLILGFILFSAIEDKNTTTVSNLLEEYDIQGTVSKLINAGIVSTLALLGIAFVTVLLAEVRNAFK